MPSEFQRSRTTSTTRLLNPNALRTTHGYLVLILVTFRNIFMAYSMPTNCAKNKSRHAQTIQRSQKWSASEVLLFCAEELDTRATTRISGILISVSCLW